MVAWTRKEKNKEVFELTIEDKFDRNNSQYNSKPIRIKTKRFTTFEKKSSIENCIYNKGKNKILLFILWMKWRWKNFGKGFVFKNNIDKGGPSSFKEILEIKNFLLPFLWNRFSIKLANIFYYE